MLDGSEISSVPLQRATDDDVVIWSLRGDGSSCVQPACPLEWNHSASSDNTRTHCIYKPFSSMLTCSGMSQWSLEGRSVLGATVPARHIFTSSLPLCLNAWVCTGKNWTPLKLVQPSYNPGETPQRISGTSENYPSSAFSLLSILGYIRSFFQ